MLTRVKQWQRRQHQQWRLQAIARAAVEAEVALGEDWQCEVDAAAAEAGSIASDDDEVDDGESAGSVMWGEEGEV